MAYHKRVRRIRAVALTAYARSEDRLRTTKVAFSSEAPVFSYEAVDTSLIKPRVRDYSKAKMAETRRATGAEMEPAGFDHYAEDEKLKAEQQTASQSHESLDKLTERF